MEKKAQGTMDSMLMVFIGAVILLVLAIALVPVFNEVFDQQVPTLNTMSNYSTFAAILGLFPVALIIGGLIVLAYIFVGRRSTEGF